MTKLWMKVCVQVEDPGWRDLDCTSDARTGTTETAKLTVKAAELCRPGLRNYRTYVKVRPSATGFRRVGATVGYSRAVRLPCKESGACRRKAVTTAQAGGYGSARKMLGILLGLPGLDQDKLPDGDGRGTRNGYEAHHIMPAGEGRAVEGDITDPVNKIQRYAYTCNILLNEPVNGVWARGPRLYNNTAFSRDHLARRARPGRAPADPHHRLLQLGREPVGTLG